MKVFDLGCAQGHVFEGWFASEDDYAQQRQRALLTCPMCGDGQVEKKLSAPRLNLRSAAHEPHAAPGSAPEPAQAPDATEQQMHAAYLHVMREWMAKTEDVGQRFASEARAMHLGDVPERAIRGQASAQEAQELAEEGIQVLRIGIPESIKQTLQ